MAGGTLSGTLISLVVALTNTTMFSDLLSWQRSLREGSWLIITSNYVALPQFQRGKPGDRQDPGDDPEADDDRRLFPAFLFEVMVERCHAEHAASRHLKARDLNDDGDRF